MTAPKPAPSAKKTSRPAAAAQGIAGVDTCRSGAVLLVIALVTLGMVVASFFTLPANSSTSTRLLQIGTALACSLPATLLWLMLLCAGKRWLARQSYALQWWLCIALGAACGTLAASLLASVSIDTSATPWLGCTLAGALFAAQTMAILLLRSQLQAPANVQAQLAELQKSMLHALWKLLRPGGRMVYCTCSLFLAEGSSQVQTFLTHNTDALLVPSAGHLIPQNGAFLGAVPDNQSCDYDGFYYALLQKQVG